LSLDTPEGWLETSPLVGHFEAFVGHLRKLVGHFRGFVGNLPVGCTL
ncbi:hypothetical protein I2484_19490, partial [Sporosarcina sp. E16_8]|nr:hypothetical protein [Sporosarcina sp. E16_8]